MDDRKAADPWATEAGAELHAVARVLIVSRYRLLGVLATLAPREDETSPVGDMTEPYDEITEMRLAIQTVVHDHLEPAIRSLLGVAS